MSGAGLQRCRAAAQSRPNQAETAVAELATEQQRKKISFWWYLVTAVFMGLIGLVGLAATGAVTRVMWWAFTLAWKL